jgi:DNA-binding CsgD family transcriptional regulator
MNNEELVSPGGTPSASSVRADTGQTPKQAPVHLTPRESEIVRYVMLGESNKQIARRLGISNYTVRDHVSNLLKKSGVSSRSRLALVLPAPVIHPTSAPIRANPADLIGVRQGPDSHALHDSSLDHLRTGQQWRK